MSEATKNLIAELREEAIDANDIFSESLFIRAADALEASLPSGRCSNPECPLRRAHSGPCAPQEWTGWDAVVLAAKYLAQTAYDWSDIETGDHSHSLECTNWEAYRRDAYDMLAALAAAQGAAPQAGTSAPSKYINPSLPGMVRNLWKSDPSEASVRTALGLAGDLIQELIDLRAAPQELSDSESEALKAAAQPYAHTFHRDGKAGLYIQIRNLPRIVAELRGGTQ